MALYKESENPVLIELSSEELELKTLGSHNLQLALEALHADGLVVLTNAVNPSHLDKLNSRMVPDARTLYAKTSTHHNFGHGTGNIQQEPCPEPGYVFDDVIANPWATQVIESMLGPNPHLRFLSANTAFKASQRQPPHIDVDFDFPRIPFGFCVNINLVETSPANGATEVWLGTHRDASPDMLNAEGELRSEVVEARRQVRRPIQPSLPKGAVIIRDFRLWHAGMPNRTEEPRVMLVTIQFPCWYRSEQRVVLPMGLKGKVGWGRLVPCVEWVEDGYDYLQGRHDHSFDLLP